MIPFFLFMGLTYGVGWLMGYATSSLYHYEKSKDDKLAKQRQAIDDLKPGA